MQAHSACRLFLFPVESYENTKNTVCQNTKSNYNRFAVYGRFVKRCLWDMADLLSISVYFPWFFHNLHGFTIKKGKKHRKGAIIGLFNQTFSRKTRNKRVNVYKSPNGNGPLELY